MSKLNNFFNIEEKILGRVYEIPKEIKPLKGDEILDERASFIFKLILNK